MGFVLMPKECIQNIYQGISRRSWDERDDACFYFTGMMLLATELLS
jgi:Fe-S cluster biosynthesis and repair protein YggX